MPLANGWVARCRKIGVTPAHSRSQPGKPGLRRVAPPVLRLALLSLGSRLGASALSYVPREGGSGTALTDEGRVLLLNRAKGRNGRDSSSLLGGLLVTTLGLAAFSRAKLPAHERRDVFVYVDEFQNFTTPAVANMFAELRKYRVGFTVAHQYLHQLEPDVRRAVLGNAATISLSASVRRTQRTWRGNFRNDLARSISCNFPTTIST